MKTVLKWIFIVVSFISGFVIIGFTAVTLLGNYPGSGQEAREKPESGQAQNEPVQVRGDSAPSPRPAEVVNKPQYPLDVTKILKKAPAEVEKVVGQPDNGTIVPFPPSGFWNGIDGKRYPAQKATYRNGSLETVYINNSLSRLTVNSDRPLDLSPKAIEAIGLHSDEKPYISYKNVVMWTDLAGYFKVSVFEKQILVITDIRYE